MLSSFHLNGHILGLHPQSEKHINKQYHRKPKVLLNFHLNGYALGFCPQTHRLETSSY